MKPDGIRDPRVASTFVIAPASFWRVFSPTWWPAPDGPIREKRNGGAVPSISGASAWARPPPLSVSSPSPST